MAISETKTEVMVVNGDPGYFYRAVGNGLCWSNICGYVMTLTSTFEKFSLPMVVYGIP